MPRWETDEDETESRPAKQEAPRQWACPDCEHLSKGPDDFASHLQRHRPVDLPGKGSKPCPKGCGRHFTVGSGWNKTPISDYRAHVSACTGEAPLVRGPIKYEEESVMGKAKQMRRPKTWECKEHKFTTHGPRAWGAHLRDHHKAGGSVPMVDSVEFKPTPLMQARAAAAASEDKSEKPKENKETFTFDEPSTIPAARKEIQDKITVKRAELAELEALDRGLGKVMGS